MKRKEKLIFLLSKKRNMFCVELLAGWEVILNSFDQKIKKKSC